MKVAKKTVKRRRPKKAGMLRRIAVLGQTITYNELQQLSRNVELLKAVIGKPNRQKKG